MVNCKLNTDFFSFSGKFLGVSSACTIFRIILPFIFASHKSIDKHSSCIWFVIGFIFWILLFWSASHSHCWSSSCLLHHYSYTKSTNCATVIIFYFVIIKKTKSVLVHISNCFSSFSFSLVMVVSLIYLSLVHLHRLYYDYGSYSLDITGPLMIITQKVTLLTFSIHDGFARNEKELTKSQQFYAVRKLPTALEYFAYVLHFQGLMAGPMVVYQDYMEFIEGTNMLKHTNANVSVNCFLVFFFIKFCKFI